MQCMHFCFYKERKRLTFQSAHIMPQCFSSDQSFKGNIPRLVFLSVITHTDSNVLQSTLSLFIWGHLDNWCHETMTTHWDSGFIETPKRSVSTSFYVLNICCVLLARASYSKSIIKHIYFGEKPLLFCIVLSIMVLCSNVACSYFGDLKTLFALCFVVYSSNEKELIGNVKPMWFYFVPVGLLISLYVQHFFFFFSVCAFKLIFK